MAGRTGVMFALATQASGYLVPGSISSSAGAASTDTNGASRHLRLEQAAPGMSGTSAFALSSAGVALAASGLLMRRRTSERCSVVACHAQEKAFAGGLVGGQSALDDEWNFDPLNISTRCAKFLPWFREAELKHGRICMLAWVGLVVPEAVRIPGPPACYEASVIEAHKSCVGPEQLGPLFQVYMFCGIVEMLTTFPKCVQGLTLENAGDYQLGTSFLPQGEDKIKEMKLKELKNGRLAMLAFGGAITQAVLTGNGFPWLYASAARSDDNAGVAAMAGKSAPLARAVGRVALRGYKMSKSVPFLPVSPALEGYAGEEEGFDPMGFSLAIDIRWLREAELKHARVAMLAAVGWVATDLGLRVPGAPFQVSTLEAHDAMVKFGAMPQMLVWMGYLELFGFLAIISMMEGKTDRKPGDFGIRALYPADPQGQNEMQLKELRNGRLAMLAFGGMATQGVLTGGTWPFFAMRPEGSALDVRKGSSFCGAAQVVVNSRQRRCATRALETSKSLPFLPKPQNLKGFVGEEQEFDPLGFSDTFDVKWLREAELKHGRVCMLATVGFMAQQYITFPDVPACADSLNALYTAPPGLTASLLFVCGYIESSAYGGKITMLDMFEGDRVPGDFNFGAQFLPKEDAAAKDMKLKELQNGRLAMFALGGMVHHNLVVKGPLFPLFPEGWAGPQGSWGIEDQSTFGMITMGQIGNEVVPP